MTIKKQQTISNRGKRRLQITANLLRKDGAKFDGENFYNVVIKTISELDEMRKSEIKSLVDWVEEYETTDTELYGHQPAPARFRKQKTAGNKRATRSALPSAKAIGGSVK
ncbi:MAG: hypothetical protein HOP25_02800 [Methylotenera sp.]|nr:hypothetical protein [Methylotenera sp.]